MKTFYLPVGLLSVLLVGCKNEEETVTAPVPEVVEFKGATDAKFVGVWQSNGGQSTLELKADGSGKSKSDVATRGGQQKSEKDLQWKVDGMTLLLNFDPKTTTRYYFKLPDPSTLELRGAEKSIIVNVYKRQK